MDGDVSGANNELIRGIYRAAVSGDGWSAVLNAIRRKADACSTVLAFSGSNGAEFRLEECFLPPDTGAEPFTHRSQVRPQQRGICANVVRSPTQRQVRLPRWLFGSTQFHAVFGDRGRTGPCAALWQREHTPIGFIAVLNERNGVQFHSAAQLIALPDVLVRPAGARTPTQCPYRRRPRL